MTIAGRSTPTRERRPDRESSVAIPESHTYKTIRFDEYAPKVCFEIMRRVFF